MRHTGHIGPDDVDCPLCVIMKKPGAGAQRMRAHLTSRVKPRGAQVSAAMTQPVRLKIIGTSCKHFGPALHDVPGCQTCGFDGKVHACSIHGQCSTLKVSRRWPNQAHLSDLMACEDCTQGERR